MDRNDPRWVEHLDIITAWGEASAANDTPPPADEQLWAATRSRTDWHLPEQIDSVLLADLRAAFNAGRWPARIDLAAVAAAVNTRGVTARVLHSSGGTATLYTGEETLDGYGDVRFSASAGPGYFDGPGRTRPFADADEFGIGPHDTSWGISIPHDATTEDVADLVVAVTREADTQLARFADAVAAARKAMWTALVAAYPDADTADLPSDLDHALVAELRRLLATWLDRYWPALHAVPAHLAASTGGTDQAGDVPG
jgi:hypothetical protein